MEFRIVGYYVDFSLLNQAIDSKALLLPTVRGYNSLHHLPIDKKFRLVGTEMGNRCRVTSLCSKQLCLVDLVAYLRSIYLRKSFNYAFKISANL